MEINKTDEESLRELSTNLAHVNEVLEGTPEVATGLADRLKHDWYQTDSQVVLTIFLRNTKVSDVNVLLSEKTANCTANLEDGSVYRLHLNLSHKVVPDKSSWKQYTSKIEIKMKKLDCIRWLTLHCPVEGVETIAPPILMASLPQDVVVQPVNVASAAVSDANLPPSSQQQLPKVAKKDWDKFAVEIQKEEASEKLEGESALNQLFQKIYAEGSDDVKKAMNKSFMESGGTVLSTNWNDIAAKKVDVNPPDGMEYKQWD